MREYDDEDPAAGDLDPPGAGDVLSVGGESAYGRDADDGVTRWRRPRERDLVALPSARPGHLALCRLSGPRLRRRRDLRQGRPSRRLLGTGSNPQTTARRPLPRRRPLRWRQPRRPELLPRPLNCQRARARAMLFSEAEGETDPEQSDRDQRAGGDAECDAARPAGSVLLGKDAEGEHHKQAEHERKKERVDDLDLDGETDERVRREDKRCAEDD